MRCFFVIFLLILYHSSVFSVSGKKIYESRCEVCHGQDGKATGLLARKSFPSATDFSSSEFREKLQNFPGIIVSSIVLRPNQKLLSKTLKDNGVTLPKFKWTEDDLRAINQYVLFLIKNSSKN